MPDVTTKHLWLEGCAAELVGSTTEMERVLGEALRAAGFQPQHTHCSLHRGHTVALAVIDDAHLVLHGDTHGQTLTVEILSCDDTAAAEAALAAVRAAVPHKDESAQSVSYQLEHDPGGFE